MNLYADPLAGCSIEYPKDWVYKTEYGDIYFAESEEALEYADPAEGPVFGIMMGSPDEMELEFGSVASVEDMLDYMLEDLRKEEGAEIGEIESWNFGEVPGAGVEVGWVDEWAEIPIRAYVIAALGEEVAGVGFGASPEDDWPSHETIFREMVASLVLSPPETPEAVERGTIEPGKTVEGMLPPNGMEVWTFDAQEGQFITIRLDAVDPVALDPYLELYDEDGLLVAENDDGGEENNARIVDFPVLVSGIYHIHALTYSGTGDYTLSLEVADEASAGGTIEYGQTVEETLVEEAEQAWFFEGDEGDVVTIAMNALDEELDCYLELYGPDGTELTYDDDSGEEFDALIEYYELPADGTFRIVAHGALFGGVGQYELVLEQTEMVVEGTLAYGDTVEATLKPGTRHHWLFEGEEGDVVTISMIAATEDLDTYLELFAPDGVQIMTDDDGSGNSNAEITEFELPLSGTYRIIARGYDDGDVGEYELALTGP